MNKKKIIFLAAVADLQDFYVKMVKHIQDALSEGWKNKDAPDLTLYDAR